VRNPGVTLWLGVSGLLALSSLLAGLAPRESLDWQPALAFVEPWRSVSAAGVHYSAAHLVANLAGAGVVAALGAVARISSQASWAWAAAWPLTHCGLLLDPQLAHYGGMSGVLHAGVAVAALHLVVTARDSRRRGIGAAIGAGLLLKIGFEFPWSPATFQPGLGIMVAPLAHASGVAAGLLCAGVAIVLRRVLVQKLHA
jgi:rhomboid family GlyGly-CTERM serine protease